MTVPASSSRRLLAVAALLAGAAALSGCAGMRTVTSDVATYGEWPAGKTPGTYSFDVLPSQAKDEKRTERLEAAAGQALQTAGFKPAPAGDKGDVTVQIGARIDRTEPDPWADPFWPGLYHRPFAPWYAHGTYWHPWGAYPYELDDQYRREVALLIRETSSGTALYETRAISTGSTEGSDHLLEAMFLASMKDFPQTNDKTHTVSVELPLAPQP